MKDDEVWERCVVKEHIRLLSAPYLGITAANSKAGEQDRVVVHGVAFWDIIKTDKREPLETEKRVLRGATVSVKQLADKITDMQEHPVNAVLTLFDFEAV